VRYIDAQSLPGRFLMKVSLLLEVKNFHEEICIIFKRGANLITTPDVEFPLLPFAVGVLGRVKGAVGRSHVAQDVIENAARDVAKRSTYRLEAFQSGLFGAVGAVDNDRVVLHRRPRRSGLRFAPAAELPRVDVLYAVAGGDGAMARACVAAGAQGLISAGFAPGLTAPDERAALEEVARGGVAVVQCSRAGSGRVARRQALREAGWIAGGDLTPHKARILHEPPFDPKGEKLRA